jgi:hypothetical protein
VHSVNGGEYTPLAQYAREQGIRITRSAPYTPESNGIAERMNRTIIKTVCTNFNQAGMPNIFWVDATRNAVRVRSSLPGHKGIIPYESLINRKPNLDTFRPFRCLGMVHVHAGARQKLDLKSIPCVLLCTLDGRNYRMYDPNTQKVLVSRNIVFTEHKFPLKEGNEIHLLEDAAIDSDESNDILSTISDSKEFDSNISPSSTDESVSEDEALPINAEDSSESSAEESEAEPISRSQGRHPTRS